jgi:crotonobetainyl-CoA:carnitine CoA-transferase CaiB-like acyl-CoA transferase
MAEPATHPAPLRGVRILAFEIYGAGPYGSQILAELGADVIKIESPSMGGDVSRSTGPFFLGADVSHFFQAFSRGKRSLALEIKTDEGRADFERLVASADAVMNNLRGDQAEKLGITYKHLAPLNPRIVCGHLSAYGRGNTRQSWPGYDYLMQAEAGLMSLTGEPDAPPARFGVSMVDYMSGTMMASGLLAALLAAARTGQGCDVDVCLFDVALHQLAYTAVWAMNENYAVERLPRGAHPTIAPTQLVRTADGWGMLMCQTEKFWRLLCTLADAAHLQADPRFADIAGRRTHLSALSADLDALFASRTTAAWCALLAGQVPFAPVNSLMQALDNPFVRETGMRDVASHPARPEGLQMLACPIKIDGHRMPAQRAPTLGEHTADILGNAARRLP